MTPPRRWLDREAPRVLIVRTSALGDIVHGLPVAVAIKRYRPRARVGWVVEEAFVPLLADHPAIDEVLPAFTRAMRSMPPVAAVRAAAALRRRMVGFAPEVVIDLMGNWKGATIARLSGCPRRLGLARAHRRERSSSLLLTHRAAPLGEHAVDAGLGLAAALGAPAAAADWQPQRWLRTAPLPGGLRPPFVVVHPGAGWRNKEYPAAAWGAVCRELARDPGVRSVVTSGPGEQPLGEEVVAAAGGAALHLPGAPFPVVAALHRAAALVLAGDTGPLHLAHALGARVLGLFGPTDPDRHGPYRAPHAAMVERLPCSFCHQRLSSPRACLLRLTPRAVADRARRSLSSDGPEAPANEPSIDPPEGPLLESRSGEIP